MATCSTEITEKDWANCQVVKRPKEIEDMTIYQRVGDWKEYHYIGLFTQSLIDDLTQRIIELEYQLEAEKDMRAM